MQEHIREKLHECYMQLASLICKTNEASNPNYEKFKEISVVLEIFAPSKIAKNSIHLLQNWENTTEEDLINLITDVRDYIRKELKLPEITQKVFLSKF